MNVLTQPFGTLYTIKNHLSHTQIQSYMQQNIPLFKSSSLSTVKPLLDISRRSMPVNGPLYTWSVVPTSHTTHQTDKILLLGTSSPDHRIKYHYALSSPKRYTRLRINDPHGEDRHGPDPHPSSRRRTLVICMVQGQLPTNANLENIPMQN